MDKSAIEQIQLSAHIPELLAGVKTDHPVTALPDSFSLVDLEKYMHFSSRYRLSYRTSSVGDFLSYNKEFADNGATCFINPDSMAAHSVFDLGTLGEPGHQDHKATLNLKKTAAFKALLEATGSQLKQKAAAEFIEDWANNLQIYTSSGDALTPSQAAKSLRDLTIDAARSMNTAVGDFNESKSVMEKIEARSQEMLPSELAFTCDPYLGLASRSFRVRVSMLTGGDAPRLVFRILKLEEAQEEMAEEFRELLSDGLSDTDISIYIGEI